MKKAAYQKYQLLIFFILLISLPLANSFFGFYTTERKDENRSFKDSLEINCKKLDKFPGDCEEYIKDNFSFRTPLLDIYHYIAFHYFKISPHPDQTIIGTKNWYFLAGKEVEIFEGRKSFSEKELNAFTEEWEKRIAYTDSLKIKTYWLICPFKHEVYSEYLPHTIFKGNKESRTQKLQKHLEQDFPRLIINPLNELLEQKKNHKLYYQLDNHWNLKAGEIVSKILVEHIQKDFPKQKIPAVPNYKWKDSVLQKGIHYNVLGIDNLQEKDAFPIISHEKAVAFPRYGFEAPEGFAYAWDYENRYMQTDMENGLRILVIRDSFGAQLIPFLKECFSESVFIFDAWKYKLDKNLIESVKPDILLYMSYSTHIDSFIE